MQKKKPLKEPPPKQRLPKTTSEDCSLDSEAVILKRDKALLTALKTPPKPLETFKGRSLTGSLTTPKSRAT